MTDGVEKLEEDGNRTKAQHQQQHSTTQQVGRKRDQVCNSKEMEMFLGRK